jgi:hypothetical protein
MRADLPARPAALLAGRLITLLVVWLAWLAWLVVWLAGGRVRVRVGTISPPTQGRAGYARIVDHDATITRAAGPLVFGTGEDIT